MSPKFEQLGRAPHLPTRVASLIMKEIAENRLKTGDRLPTEHKLAETFGVSRNVVREAVARLKSDGVVESRQGVGAFISAPEKHSAIRLDSEALKDVTALQHLFELRTVLEVSAAGMAALNRTEDQLMQMSATFQKISLANDESIDADIEFHRLIALASGNPYFTIFVSYIAGQVSDSIYKAHEVGENRSTILFNNVIQEHNTIFEAIKAQDEQAARDGMQTHLVNSANYLKLEL